MSSVQIFLVYSILLFAEFFYAGPSCLKGGYRYPPYVSLSS